MSDALPKLADAIVVGGGIVGAAVARQLAKDGVDTVLLEDRAFGGAVSGASLACLGTHMHNLDELAVLVEACGLWRDIAEELGNPFEYNRSGQLRFILYPEDVVVAQRWIDGERAFGLPNKLNRKINANDDNARPSAAIYNSHKVYYGIYLSLIGSDI